MFYRGWGNSWSPFVGMFVARISKERTVRDFLLRVMVVPTLLSFVWMSVFGHSALNLQVSGAVDIVSAVPDDVAAVLAEGVDARLLNCSRPEAVSAAWPAFSTPPGVTGAYANGFTSVENLEPGGTVAGLEARRDLGPDAYAGFALRWVEQGATIVGGCCEVGPAHIRHLAARLRSAGYSIGCPELR